MFAPLAGEESAGNGAGFAISQKSVAIIPVPQSAPPCDWSPSYGTLGGIWPYHDKDGNLVCHVARVNRIRAGQSEKEFLPITYCLVQDLAGDRCAWRPQGVPAPRPLFNLPALLAAPNAPVIVCEGEKKAEAAPRIFPGYLGTTSMGGAQAAKRSDWSPLANRDVTIWPDHDEPGRAFAENVAALVAEAGAASILIVQVPASWPETWDIGDPIPDGEDPNVLHALLTAARPWVAPVTPRGTPEHRLPAYVSFGAFRMTDNGLWYDVGDDKPLWLSAPFEVLAHTRDAQGNAWGKLLRWHDLVRRFQNCARIGQTGRSSL
jgi:hypothetical protein